MHLPQNRSATFSKADSYRFLKLILQLLLIGTTGTVFLALSGIAAKSLEGVLLSFITNTLFVSAVMGVMFMLFVDFFPKLFPKHNIKDKVLSKTFKKTRINRFWKSYAIFLLISANFFTFYYYGEKIGLEVLGLTVASCICLLPIRWVASLQRKSS